MASQQEILDINGVDVHVTVDGPENALALTFAHALSLDLRSFDPQVAAFRDTYKVVRLDLRRHGKSDVGGGHFPLKTSRVMWPACATGFASSGRIS